MLLPDSEQRLTELDGLSVLDVDLFYRAARLGENLVHQLHRLDDADDRLRRDVAADLDERLGFGRRRAVERADDGRREREQLRSFSRAGGRRLLWSSLRRRV